MLQINPKKFKNKKNKSIPSPLRPKFRQKSQTSIYFLSQRKVKSEKRANITNKIKIFSALSIIIIGGFLLSN